MVFPTVGYTLLGPGVGPPRYFLLRLTTFSPRRKPLPRRLCRLSARFSRQEECRSFGRRAWRAVRCASCSPRAPLAKAGVAGRSLLPARFSRHDVRPWRAWRAVRCSPRASLAKTIVWRVVRCASCSARAFLASQECRRPPEERQAERETRPSGRQACLWPAEGEQPLRADRLCCLPWRSACVCVRISLATPLQSVHGSRTQRRGGGQFGANVVAVRPVGCQSEVSVRSDEKRGKADC